MPMLMNVQTGPVQEESAKKRWGKGETNGTPNWSLSLWTGLKWAVSKLGFERKPKEFRPERRKAGRDPFARTSGNPPYAP